MTTGGPRVRLTVLGPMRVTVDGAPVDIGGPRRRAVLALLALARGEVVPTERVVDALWPEGRPAEPLAALHSSVSRLRRALQPDAAARGRGALLVSGANGYALRLEPDAVDAWRFERLVREASEGVRTDPGRAAQLLSGALDLWGGPALGEYADEPWAQPEVTRLDELRTVAREHLLAARLDLGDAAVTVPDLEALVAEAPLREERWRLLALGLYRAHRQADALAALRRARAALADELGVDPGPALRALEEQVLAQSPDLSPVPALVPPRVPADGDVPRAAPHRPAAAEDELVERHRELQLLEACVRGAQGGTGALAVVAGPAGIGKSRLLAEARVLGGRAGATVLHARASELEREFSFGVVRQLFEPHVVDPAARAALLQGAAAAAAPVFDLASAHATADDSSFATLHGLYWLTVGLAARSPLVLVVDDVHWCDGGSLRFLAYLARRLDGLGTSVVLGLRTGEHHPLAAVIDDLRYDVSTVPVTPVPLTRDAVATMLRTRLGAQAEDEFVDACFEGTTGNPLLVRQLLRALEADGVRPDREHVAAARALGSRAVSSMVLLRLRRLPAPATAVARALAVLGDGAALPHVAALAQLGEAQTAELSSLLVAGEVVRPEPPLGFVHALVRDAVYRDVPPGERELLHEAAARVLAGFGRPDEQVAAQLLQAPRRGDPWVVEVLRSAARDAVRRGSSDGAVTFLKRALAEPPDGRSAAQTLLELGLVETATDGPAAGRDLQAAYDALTDPAARATAALALTRTLVFVGRLGSPVQFAAQALAALPPEAVDERAAVLALQRVGGHMHGVDAAVWDLAREPEVPGNGPGSRMLQAAVAYERMCRTEPSSAAVEPARAALADGQLVAADPGLMWVWAQAVLDLADEDVLPMWETINAAAHSRGSLFSVLAVGLWQGFALMRRGELAEAEQSICAAMEQLETWQREAMTMAYVRACLGRVYFDQGRSADARRVVGPSGSPVSALDGDRLVVEMDAELLLADGRPGPALRRLDAVVHRAPEVTNPAWRRDRLLWCLAAQACGRDAVAEAESLLGLARRWGAPSVVGDALLVLGRVLGPDGGPVLREAVEVLRPAPVPVRTADALVALATAVTTPPDEAVPLLREAHALGRRTGAGRVVAAAEQALAAAGLPLPAQREGRAPGLTSTERRVLRLAGAGATVHEIGQQLFMTPSAVRAHLDAARSRQEGSLATT